MNLSPYQIHSVLKTYANKLIRQKEEPARDQTRIPVEGKRLAVIERIAADIVNRITQIGLQHTNFCELRVRSEEQPKVKETQFTYNRIDKGNQKTTCTFSVKNSRELIKDLSEME